MRIASGATDKKVLFVAKDATDFTTNETGLSSFTVYRSRDGGTATAYTTPTIAEIDATNMPGLYALTVDEDTTITSGDDEESYVLRITHAGMAPVTIEIELFRPKITEGQTVTAASGRANADTVAVSGDTTAADNLELMYDGTGYTAETAPASRAQVDGISSSSGSAFNYDAGDDNTGGAIKSVTFVGVETSGTFASTSNEDGTYHQIDDTGNAIDIVYQFDVGAVNTALDVRFKGYLNSANDQITIQAYNFVGTAWETVFTLDGQAGSTNVSLDLTLFSRNTGSSGADNGLVLVRFVNSGQTNPTLYVDQLVVSAAASLQVAAYTNGSVWVDESSGTSTGTTVGIDGTFVNQSDDFDNGQTIADSLGTSLITIHPGNSVTLAAALQGYTINNVQATLNGGSQNVDSTRVNGGFIAGTWTRAGTGVPTFNVCNLTAVTTARAAFIGCGFVTGTHTFTEAGVYAMVDCQAAGGSGTLPIIDCSSVALTISIQRWTGNLTINNIVTGATIGIHCASGGDITLAGTGGTVNISGAVGSVTDNRSGGTLNDNSITRANVNAEADTALADYDPPTRTEATSDKDEILALLPAALVGGRMDSYIGAKASGVGLSTQEAADVNTEVDTGLSDISLETVDGRLPAALVGGRMDSNTSAINNSNSAAVRLALSAGQIIPGTVDTVTNTHTPTTTEFQADDITEATADHYNGRIVIFTSGALAGQATDITDYAAVGGIGQFTVTAMTEAPANNDTFVIV